MMRGMENFNMPEMPGRGTEGELKFLEAEILNKINLIDQKKSRGLNTAKEEKELEKLLERKKKIKKFKADEPF